MKRISLSQANRIIEAVFERAADIRTKPLAVAVLDPGGHHIAFQRQDGAPIGRFHIASRKAAGALTVGASSRRIGEMAASSHTFLPGLLAFAPGGAIAAAGGVIVVADGDHIGAVGVTGDSPDTDEMLALHGIASAGLTAL